MGAGQSAPGMTGFNVSDGFLEAIVRGLRSDILTAADYGNLAQSESLEDMKLHLMGTDYRSVLINEPSPLSASTISERCTQKLVEEFHHFRSQATEPLGTFLDFISYSYMVDNIVLLITGALHERDISELIDKCHPLGMFENMATLCVASTPSELYQSVLVDTPLAPFFVDCISEEDLDELNIEIIRNSLHRAQLQSFYNFCQTLGGPTAEVMAEILEFEADRRAINITLNSFGTELTKDDRIKLYPRIGKLFPAGTMRLAKAEDQDAVRAAVDYYGPYREFFNESGLDGDKSLEDLFFEREVVLNKQSFEQQMQYGVFYSYFKLKEQEIRNIVWIAECVSQHQKDKIGAYINIF